MSQHDFDAELQKELDAAMGELDMEAMLNSGPAATGDDADAKKGSGRPRSFKTGDRATGRIISVTPEDVFVELGPRHQGVCSIVQFEEQPKVGDPIEVTVQRFDKSEGLFYLTRVGAVQKADWENLQEGQVVEARCTGVNKGGLEMEVAGHRAFMPAGQIDIYRTEDLEQFKDQTLTCEVIEFNREKRNIVLSRREVLVREQAAKREEIFSKLTVGDTVEGIVRKLMPFGAFVDLGAGVDGLVHVSDLAWERVSDPAKVVAEGQRVKVQVLAIDEERNRIGLGLKQTQADPFESIGNELAEGATVTGRVTKITAFGAFVEIEPGVEGLIHISQLSHERVNRVSQIVSEGEVVTAQILDIDPDSRRISLSMKALKESQAESAERPADASMERLKARFGSDRPLKGGLG